MSAPRRRWHRGRARRRTPTGSPRCSCSIGPSPPRWPSCASARLATRWRRWLLRLRGRRPRQRWLWSSLSWRRLLRLPLVLMWLGRLLRLAWRWGLMSQLFVSNRVSRRVSYTSRPARNTSPGARTYTLMLAPARLPPLVRSTHQRQTGHSSPAHSPLSRRHSL